MEPLTTPDTITLSLDDQGNWLATYEGPTARDIRWVYGTNTLKTQQRLPTTAAEVAASLRRSYPYFRIIEPCEPASAAPPAPEMPIETDESNPLPPLADMAAADAIELIGRLSILQMQLKKAIVGLHECPPQRRHYANEEMYQAARLMHFERCNDVAKAAAYIADWREMAMKPVI